MFVVFIASHHIETPYAASCAVWDVYLRAAWRKAATACWAWDSSPVWIWTLSSHHQKQQSENQILNRLTFCTRKAPGADSSCFWFFTFGRKFWRSCRAPELGSTGMFSHFHRVSTHKINFRVFVVNKMLKTGESFSCMKRGPKSVHCCVGTNKIFGHQPITVLNSVSGSRSRVRSFFT